MLLKKKKFNHSHLQKNSHLHGLQTKNDVVPMPNLVSCHKLTTLKKQEVTNISHH